MKITAYKKLFSYCIIVFVGMLSMASSCESGELDDSWKNDIKKDIYYIRYETSINGKPLYNFDGQYIRRETSSTGKPLYNFDGQYIRREASSTGKPLYNFDGQYIRRETSSTGKPIYNIRKGE
ncbi:hypothetical protein [Dysgonomonas sp. 520]|uniref:hypothetical protein n=1 Tax=Dysgonomonas sp. 520 TaxID=2302931 RepID=UPI0013D0AB28|nr:hypothetical protein [Dysgonomonas sp. 520]NDW09502.1 hypothetical protein [Dysgonomonas sp. 520]